MKARILVVDDDPVIRHLVLRRLEAEGFQVFTAESAEEALVWIETHGLPHLAIVDLVMPGVDGIELCRQVQKYSDLPAILLSAVDERETVVRAIEEVAEDYVTKPFDPEELVARIRRVLHRTAGAHVERGPLTRIDGRLAVDFPRQTLFVDDRPVLLTPTESKLLHILVRNARRTVRTDYLLQELWPREEVYEDALRVHVHRLRQKIEPEPRTPRYVVTRRGQGYRFHPDDG
jgi:DNA-binding response OmpR family regulator